MQSLTVTYEQFAAAVGTSFKAVLGSSEACPLRLAEVSERRLASGFETFSLTLNGPLMPELGQGIHRLVHETLGTQDLFLVPEQRKPDGMQYHVAFNRTAPQDHA